MMNFKKIILPILVASLAFDAASQVVTEKGIGSIELDKTTCRENRPTDKKSILLQLIKQKNLLGINILQPYQLIEVMHIMHLNKIFLQN